MWSEEFSLSTQFNWSCQLCTYIQMIMFTNKCCIVNKHLSSIIIITHGSTLYARTMVEITNSQDVIVENQVIILEGEGRYMLSKYTREFYYLHLRILEESLKLNNLMKMN